MKTKKLNKKIEKLTLKYDDLIKKINNKDIILNHRTNSSIITLGSHNDKKVKADINNQEIAIAGFIGSGKTALISSYLQELMSQNNSDKLGFILINPKSGFDFDQLSKKDFVKLYLDGSDDNIKDFNKFLHDLIQVKLVRQNKLKLKNVKLVYINKNKFEELISLDNLVIVLDDLLLLSCSLQNLDEKEIDKNYYEDYKSLIAELSSDLKNSSMTLISASQRTVDKAFPNKLIDNADIKIAMKLQFISDTSKLFGLNNTITDIADLPVYQAYILSKELKQPVLLNKLPHIEVEYAGNN